MSLFVKDGKIKSTILLNAFMLSLVYAGVYLLVFIASNVILEKIIPETSAKLLLVWIPPFLTGLAASILCALPLFFTVSYRTVQYAFMLLALYAAFIAALVLAKAESSSRSFLAMPLIFYFAIPVLTGNLVCLCIIKIKK